MEIIIISEENENTLKWISEEKILKIRESFKTIRGFDQRASEKKITLIKDSQKRKRILRQNTYEKLLYG